MSIDQLSKLTQSQRDRIMLALGYEPSKKV